MIIPATAAQGMKGSYSRRLKSNKVNESGWWGEWQVEAGFNDKLLYHPAGSSSRDGQADGNTHKISAFGTLEISQTQKGNQMFITRLIMTSLKRTLIVGRFTF